MAALVRSGLYSRCITSPGRLATDAEISLAHTSMVPSILASIQDGHRTYLDLLINRWVTSDTYITRHTYHCARLSAGCCIESVEAVLSGSVSRAMSINRPPGHHAESNVIMGFCPLNNAAIAARVAQQKGLTRILLLDWDVHHGNGTEEILYNNPGVVYISLHRHDFGTFYPGTGDASRVGGHRAPGRNVNVPWDHLPGETRVGDGDYVAVMRHVVIPIAEELKPELVIVSAGFDAVKGDPVGRCRVSPECFGYLTHLLLGLGVPTVLLLEGGYNLDMTSKAVGSCLAVLQGASPRVPGDSHLLTPAGARGIRAALRAQRPYWRALAA